jgi:hypothetical protein
MIIITVIFIILTQTVLAVKLWPKLAKSKIVRHYTCLKIYLIILMTV